MSVQSGVFDVSVKEADVLQALDAIQLPGGKKLGSSGRVTGIVINDGKVICAISIEISYTSALRC